MEFIEKIKEIMELNKALKLYGKYYAEYRKTIRQICHYYTKKKDYSIAIWGTGLKGKAFLRVIDPDLEFVDCCYDIDPKKVGITMPTGHVVEDYTRSDKEKQQIILLMNSNFETETAAILEEQGIKAVLINLDNLIIGELSAKEIVAMYREEFL